MPLPKDQFSFFTSTRLTITSATARAPASATDFASLANNAFFMSVVRPSLQVI